MINTIIVDIETLDVKTSATVLSIGAFAFNRFDLNGTRSEINSTDSQNKLHIKLDIAEQIISGRTVSEETQTFWLENNIGKHFNGKGFYVSAALCEFIDFITHFIKENKELRIYSRGMDFDFKVLAHLFTQYQIINPIKFWQERDVRTCIDALSNGNNGYLNGFKSDINYQKHHALDDAMRDAEMMCAAYDLSCQGA